MQYLPDRRVRIPAGELPLASNTFYVLIYATTILCLVIMAICLMTW